MIEDLWYKNAVVYSLDLETFVDGNGDGVGDIAGLIRRLDYLETLGVDVIWLAPFYPSPDRDDGYDVTDHYGVDPRYGSPGDLVELIRQAHQRGLKVIVDLVVNHTSDEHPWFTEARASTSSRRRSWYVWSKTRPRDWDEGMVFPGVQRSTWTRDPISKEYYFHRFFEFQPDLDVDEPEVRAEIRKIMAYWLQLGVDGFRVDAVPFVIERPDPSGRGERTQHFEYLEEMRAAMQWCSGTAVMLGEANVTPEETQHYFRQGRGIQMMFNFWVNQHLFYALATGDARPLAQALLATRELPPSAQWAQFLRNHDELDLGRLTDAQRQEVFARFGPDPSMQLYDRGIRRRLAPMLGSRAHLELAYSACFALPGTPVIRYGDEIGMGDDLSLPERDAVRTPMQWSSNRHGGFSTSERTVHPVIDSGVYDYRHVNVEDQRRDPTSMLRWTGHLIRVRKECPEIGWGTWEILETGSMHVLAMRFAWRGTSVVTIHNFDGKPHEIAIDVPEKLIDLWRTEEHEPDERGRHHLAIAEHGYRWLRVGDLDYALMRRETEGSSAVAAKEERAKKKGGARKKKSAKR